jgi:hypothetical protein
MAYLSVQDFLAFPGINGVFVFPHDGNLYMSAVNFQKIQYANIER